MKTSGQLKKDIVHLWQQAELISESCKDPGFSPSECSMIEFHRTAPTRLRRAKKSCCPGCLIQWFSSMVLPVGASRGERSLEALSFPWIRRHDSVFRPWFLPLSPRQPCKPFVKSLRTWSQNKCDCDTTKRVSSYWGGYTGEANLPANTLISSGGIEPTWRLLYIVASFSVLSIVISYTIFRTEDIGS